MKRTDHVFHKTCSNHVTVSDERSQICTATDTEVLKNPNYHSFNVANWMFQSTPITWTVFCVPSSLSY